MSIPKILGQGNGEISENALATIVSVAAKRNSVRYFDKSVITDVVLPLCVAFDLSQPAVLRLLVALKDASLWGRYYIGQKATHHLFGSGALFQDKKSGVYYFLCLQPYPALDLEEALAFCQKFIPVRPAARLLTDIPFDELANLVLNMICCSSKKAPRAPFRGRLKPYCRQFLRVRALQDGRTIPIASLRERFGIKRFSGLLHQAYYLAEVLEYDELFRNMVALKCLSKYENTRRIAQSVFTRMEDAHEKREKSRLDNSSPKR